MKMLVLVLFLCGATPALCEIYTWKDKRGTAHYTNSLYEIPDRYRSKAKVLDLGIEPKGDTPSQQQNRQQPAMSQPPPLPTTVVRPEVHGRKSSSHRAVGRPRSEE
jgi:Domain of unknown function (DUF4124)